MSKILVDELPKLESDCPLYNKNCGGCILQLNKEITIDNIDVDTSDLSTEIITDYEHGFNPYATGQIDDVKVYGDIKINSGSGKLSCGSCLLSKNEECPYLKEYPSKGVKFMKELVK